MAIGMKEDPALSPANHLDGIDWPASREFLVQNAADNGGSMDVINIFKSLPRDTYHSQEEVMRDFAEAGRRFGMSNFAADDDGAVRDRRNLGRDAIENAPEHMTRHP